MVAGVPHSCVGVRKALPHPKNRQSQFCPPTSCCLCNIAPEGNLVSLQCQAHHLVMLDVTCSTGRQEYAKPFKFIAPPHRHTVLTLSYPIILLHQNNVPGAISSDHSALSWAQRYVAVFMRCVAFAPTLARRSDIASPFLQSTIPWWDRWIAM